MFIKQFYTNSLSEVAYFIESEGEAAIIDPLPDIEAYLLLAKERSSTIKYIFETHFHADFVSGLLDLSKATAAPIVYGPETKTKFKSTTAKDGEVFSIGKLQLTVLYTPGHTIGSTCYLLKDGGGKEVAVFTGDTLLVDDVGSPNLVSGDRTTAEMAGLLYDSLHNKILTLTDDVIVYPGNGLVDKNIGTLKQSTIGVQRQTNAALKHSSKEAFINAMTNDLAAPLAYFPVNAKINKEGSESVNSVLETSIKALSIKQFKDWMDKEAIILDTRNALIFSQGFITGSIFIGLEGKFEEWAGNFLPSNTELILVTEAGKEKETVVRLAQIGFSKIAGYLKGGFKAWQNAGEKIDLIIDVEADELAMDIPFDDLLVVVDVRKEVEYADGHVKGAVNIPVGTMVDPASMADIEDTDNLYLHCEGDFRSTIAASLLKRQGIHNLRKIIGGWAKIKDQPEIKTEKDASVLN